ncbi:hypothetical protein PspTeo4_10472 [Pseudomonas sp. Teo4]|nr:hypothetical protein [Pseudomonas sp. Teo4]
MNQRIPVIEIAPSEAKPRNHQADTGIHTRSFTGLYRNLRIAFAGALFVLFFGTAWLNWNGRQAVLWDLSSSKFHIFGATFWPQDFILLSALLIICAFGLFAITVYAGRVWCGYSCPQSTWTWLFMWCEKVAEGDRNQRIKLAAAPWSLAKVARRTLKHSLWLAIGVLTGLTFVGYFTDPPPGGRAVHLATGRRGAVLGAVLHRRHLHQRRLAARGGVPAHVPVCALPERDVRQGHPGRGLRPASRRGPRARKKGSDARAQGLGDCIDCTLCVQVCPTGIDIRDGLQMACIGCAACIDACDGVMDKMGYPRGLIGYKSEHSLQGGTTHWLRPRLLGYAAALLVMIGALVVALQMRPMVSLDVIKDRGLFRENALGQIENIYLLKVINKTEQTQRYQLRLDDAEGFELHGPGELIVAAGEMSELPVSVAMLAERPSSSSQTLSFVIEDTDEPEVRSVAQSRFVAPMNR